MSPPLQLGGHIRFTILVISLGGVGVVGLSCGVGKLWGGRMEWGWGGSGGMVGGVWLFGLAGVGQVAWWVGFCWLAGVDEGSYGRLVVDRGGQG